MPDKDNDGIPDSLDAHDDRPEQGPPTPEPGSGSGSTGNTAETHDNKGSNNNGSDSGTNKPKDSDRDGIPDKNDEFPNNENKGDPDRGTKRKVSKNDDKSDRLTGRRGRDYEIVRGPGGGVWVIYKAKLANGKVVRTKSQIPNDRLDHYGIGKNEGQHLTKAQLKKMPDVGFVGDIQLKGRHPIQAFFEEVGARYGVAPSLLKNKQVMEILLEAHLEQWDGSKLLGALQATKWAQNRTETRKTWVLELGDAEKAHQVGLMVDQLKREARNQFGAKDWTKYISDKQLTEWATNAKSGAKGWDDGSAFAKIEDAARKVPGTTAAVNWEASTPATESDLEGRFEQVRDEAISWLGYTGKNGSLTPATLKRWAADLENGVASDSDWENYLKQQARNIHGWLNPDEKWMDAVEPFKQKAESLMGRELAYDDKLFGSLARMDKDGSPVDGGKQRMTFADFELAVRADDRAWKRGTQLWDEGMGLLNQMNNVFNGVSG